MITLMLYTTLGCHLCEELEHHLAHLAGVEYSLARVEIAEDEALMVRYGVRIPVLVDEGGEELDRGFEAKRLATWLQARGWLDVDAWRERHVVSPPSRGAVMRGGRRYLG
ncbi:MULTISPECIES: glutaredoxin family protein [Halomonadaceae]|uniref:glutaredoxin family protein n=1 Tax=Halomonadaceae TaxID=28256 RepID=UPI001599B6F0|nr:MULTISPECIES: glutaredoxin family protein [Halomonas]QJQ95714.1 glutaredoxin family protein [Halomonas sp. PA5]